MRDLTALIDTRDCSTVGCPNEADGPDGRCRLCRTAPSRRTSLAPQPGGLAHLMNDDQEVPQPVTTTTCKVDGCGRPDAGKRGSWVGLCVEHIAIEGRRRQQLARERFRKPTTRHLARVPPTTNGQQPAETAQPPAPREAPPGRLTELAQQADKALDELIAARERHTQAVDRLRQALNEQAA